ncbi:glycosyltransferase family 2 protein [Flavisolibacter ginsenosidimutans]|uniref:Glycosyltransferase family 2 protein n=1 Tax=Flavisolibacter ginsenosidimutans TaxID=661481 RepID=A0A5B8UKG5_9BACT|nr:glycosyltransferase family A protein [Flavisolibacter ginsenosidimutans]QEC56669.1 glycosyltransferase family 2 protein [Flavisolibacter ginsenosidimutans]
MSEVKLSVLMPAYNVAAYIGDAIASVLNQSFKEFELVIVNDGSTDNTGSIIRNFNDGRIVLINQENKGIAAALNKALEIAKGDYVARFDADDICYPHRLAKQYNFMTAHSSCVIAGSAADYVDEKGEYVFTNYPPAYTDDEIRSVLKRICPFIHSSVICKKTALLKHGGYNEHAHSFEDHLLWQSVLSEGRVVNFHEPLIQVRLNPESVTIDEQWRPRTFHQIKQRVIEENFITAKQGEELLQIIQSQNNPQLKESAYHSLLAKKFLWNNYQPQKARKSLKKVLVQNKLHWKSYCFYALSFLPRTVLQKGYRLLKPQAVYLTHQRKN